MNASGGFAGGDFYQRYAEQARAAEDAVNSLAAAESKRFNAGIGLAFSYQGIFEQLADKETELADALAAGWLPTSKKVLGLKDDIAELEGQLDETTNKFILDMKAMELAAGGWTDDEMIEYLKLAESLGIIGDKAFDASVQALGLGAALRAIEREVFVDIWITEHSSSDATQKTGRGDKTTRYGMAGGGTANVGEWAMVGDSMGGGVTPYTEYVHANKGGGFTVYNQSQMAGRSAPPMAGRGIVMPTANEVTLSDKSIRDLADALAYKMALVQ
jgi:hypothetical protein